MAQKFISPGILRVEKDISEIIAPAGTSIGALVGKTNKGPINQRVLLTSDQEFIETFGVPESATDLVHYAALEFTKESAFMWFVRSSNGDEAYSNQLVPTEVAAGSVTSSTITATTTTSTLIAAGYEDGNTFTSQNGEPGIFDLESNAPTGTNALLMGCIGPGVYGNDIGASIVTTASSALDGLDNGLNWKFLYDDPETNGDPSSASDAVWKSVYRINVYTKPQGQNDTYWGNGTTAEISAVTPDETYLVSNDPSAKDATGSSLYAPDVINGNSSLIYVVSRDNNYVTESLSITSLAGGATGVLDSAGSKQAAWGLFSDREKVEANILMVPDEPVTAADVTTIKTVGNIAASRQDCIAVAQVGDKNDTTATSIVDSLISPAVYSFNNPSFVALYAGYDQIFDRFIDKKLFIPKCIAGAALMARTDRVANTWDAPAGINRGILGNAIGQLSTFNEAQIGFLYDNNINTSKFIRGQGHVMWGQKTAQRKKSALDRINVRRMLLFLENSVEPSLLPFLFEINNDANRSRVFSIVDGFLSQMQAQGALTKYQVVVDESNNTPQVIDNNQLNVDIFVQPARVIEFIQLQVIITRTGVNFAELL